MDSVKVIDFLCETREPRAGRSDKTLLTIASKLDYLKYYPQRLVAKAHIYLLSL